MKLLPKYLCLSVAIIGVAASTTASAALLTFDNLPGGGPLDVTQPAVPNGYGGLNWNNFAVADSSKFGTDSGYYRGVVSLKNEVFNPFGDPASISDSGATFDLDSAYLTAALNLSTPLNIQVQGFLGTTLLFNKTVVVYNTGPTLFDFNFDNVNKVTFISFPGQQFVMDNASVTIPDTANTSVLIGMAIVGLVVLRKTFQNRIA